METGFANDVGQALTFSTQALDAIEAGSRSGSSSCFNKSPMLRHLGWSIAMNETGRFRKVDRPAKLNLRARRLGPAKLLFDGMPQNSAASGSGRLSAAPAAPPARRPARKDRNGHGSPFQSTDASSASWRSIRQTDPAGYREPRDAPSRQRSSRRWRPSASSSHRYRGREPGLRKPDAAHCASALAGECPCSGARQAASSVAELDVHRPYGSPDAQVRRRDLSDGRMAERPPATDHQRSDGRKQDSCIAIAPALAEASLLLLDPANPADGGHTSRAVGSTWRRMLNNALHP